LPTSAPLGPLARPRPVCCFEKWQEGQHRFPESAARSWWPGWSAIPTKVRELISLLESDGWFKVRQKRSQRQYHHAVKPGTVTVPGKPSDDLAPGTLNSILKQAGLK